MNVNEITRSTLIRNLLEGDIFHAKRSNSQASLICLVESVSDNTIHARRLIVQQYLEFNRQTGEANWEENKCRINSVAPLPIKIHNTMLALDRKNRLSNKIEQIKLSISEQKALSFVGCHYRDTLI